MKKKITDKSIELFERKGFTQTSIQDVVQELNVTKGTFYYYFKSKEQLLMEIHLEYIDNFLERQKKIMQESSISNKDKITNLIALFVKDIRTNGARGRVFFREIRHLSNHNMDIVKQKRNQVRFNIESIVKNGIKQGEFRNDLNPDIIAFAILSLTNYSYQWFKPDGKITEGNLVQMYVDIIFNGMNNK